MPDNNYHELESVVIKKQDEKLEQVLGTIESIKGQTLIIGNELNEQANLMENLREHMEHTDSMITRTARRVEEAYAAALDTKFTLVTSILAFILFILFIILIVT